MFKIEEPKQFQYEIQGYQEDCVNNIINLFENLSQKSSFIEIFEAHHRINKYNFSVQDSKKY